MSKFKFRTEAGGEWQELPLIQGDKGDKGDPGEKGDKGDPGSNYVITQADYEAIAEVVFSMMVNASEVAY